MTERVDITREERLTPFHGKLIIDLSITLICKPEDSIL